MLPLAYFVGIFAGALWLGLAARGFWKLIDLGEHWKRWRLGRARRKAVQAYIPHMSEDDRVIIGYLLERNQKTFDCAVDGGYAVSLISRGIIVSAARRGQLLDMERVPMKIPDDVWEVLSENRDAFPAKFEGTMHPWRVHWMAR
ncbi:hypothetical protein NTCA1_02830 [Novosphingobium sp. TCA1]|nr:hypothetical protein NTCA1_02830 [Novosphingobium sp. TCA1]